MILSLCKSCWRITYTLTNGICGKCLGKKNNERKSKSVKRTPRTIKNPRQSLQGVQRGEAVESNLPRKTED